MNPGESRCAENAAPVYAAERCERDRTSHPAHKLDGRCISWQETRQPLTCVFYLIDRETGETKRIDKVPPEALEKMSKRLSENMSAYYTRHMDEYVRLEV